MKKVTVFFTFLVCSVVMVFAQNATYSQLMQKASEYEKQNKLVYAMGAYYDAACVGSTLEDIESAEKKYSDIADMVSSGKPGFEEYDEFSLYDGWKKIKREFSLYEAENFPYVFKFGTLDKGELNYEKRTASYSIKIRMGTGNKLSKIKKSIDNGYSKVKRSDWPAVDFSDSEIKTMAKECKKYWFFQENNSAGVAFYSKVRLPGRTESYTDWVSTDGRPLQYKWSNELGDVVPINGKKVMKTREVKGDRQSLMSISFVIADKSGSTILRSGDVAITGDSMTKIFNDIPSEVMKKIDSGDYKIVPGTIKLRYGYLPEKLSLDLSELKNMKIAEFPIVTSDVSINSAKEIAAEKKAEEERLAIEAKAERLAAEKRAEEERIVRIEKAKRDFYLSDDGKTVTGLKNKQVTEVVIPDSVTKIEGSAFSGCTSLTSITIPDSVTSIGSEAFSGCKRLTSITIPDSVTKIEVSAFSGCTSLTSITIPNSVTKIEDWAFSGCTSLTSITIPNSVTEIGYSAFSDCMSLTSITIPNSVTSIDAYAFSGCTSLTSITIPNSVTSIRSEAFDGCTNLTINISKQCYNKLYKESKKALSGKKLNKY